MIWLSSSFGNEGEHFGARNEDWTLSKDQWARVSGSPFCTDKEYCTTILSSNFGFVEEMNKHHFMKILLSTSQNGGLVWRIWCCMGYCNDTILARSYEDLFRALVLHFWMGRLSFGRAIITVFSL